MLLFSEYEKLIVGDCLRIRVEFEYFPFDAAIFRGFGRQVPDAEGQLLGSMARAQYGQNGRCELLADIRQFCAEDPSQNVEIRRGETVFNACRFLVCARSKVRSKKFNSSVAI